MQSFFIFYSQIVAEVDLKLVFIISKIFFLMSIVLIKSDYCSQLMKLVSFLHNILLNILSYLSIILDEYIKILDFFKPLLII